MEFLAQKLLDSQTVNVTFMFNSHILTICRHTTPTSRNRSNQSQAGDCQYGIGGKRDNKFVSYSLLKIANTRNLLLRPPSEKNKQYSIIFIKLAQKQLSCLFDGQRHKTADYKSGLLKMRSSRSFIPPLLLPRHPFLFQNRRYTCKFILFYFFKQSCSYCKQSRKLVKDDLAENTTVQTKIIPARVESLGMRHSFPTEIHLLQVHLQLVLVI